MLTLQETQYFFSNVLKKKSSIHIHSANECICRGYVSKGYIIQINQPQFKVTSAYLSSTHGQNQATDLTQYNAPWFQMELLFITRLEDNSLLNHLYITSSLGLRNVFSSDLFFFFVVFTISCIMYLVYILICNARYTYNIPIYTTILQHQETTYS